MTAEKPNLADSNEPEGHAQLQSHVQGQPPVYGEPKGPTPGSLLQRPLPGNTPDRDRDGFVGGRDVRSRGDEVGNGPEEWEHAAGDLPGGERNTKPASEDDTAAND